MTRAEKKKLKYEQKMKEMEAITPEAYEKLQNKLAKKATIASRINIGLGVYIALAMLVNVFFPLPVRIFFWSSIIALMPAVVGIYCYTEKQEKEFKLNNECRTKFLTSEEQDAYIQQLEQKVIQQLSNKSSKKVVKQEQVVEDYEDVREL